METPLLVAGLGNPGTKYSETFHNLGFQTIDTLSRRWNIPRPHEKFNSLFADISKEGKKIILQKPLTFMNRSGEAVSAVAEYYQIPHENILVIVDDLDLPKYQIRVRKGGGDGGHNGLHSIIEALGGEDFPRVRIGIGRSVDPAAYVLSPIPKSEKSAFLKSVERAADAVESFIENGMEKTMNRFNGPTEEVT